MSYVPPLVQQALALAERMQFGQSCTADVGRLLAVLAAQRRCGTVGEIGTGCGVGAAWIISGLAAEATFVTVELDSGRAAAVQALFAGLPAVCVLAGDWHDLLAHGPFDLLFADGGKAKAVAPETLVQALKPGGVIVLDDLTPEEQWPAAWRGQVDAVR